MIQTPTWAQLLKQAIDHRLMDVHTALIAKVESYDADNQLVDVSPVLKRQVQTLDGEWTSEQLPMLCDVPVLFPRAGGYFISFPIQPGDFVQLIFNDVDIEEWLEGTEPTTARNQRFTLQGAVAIPGIYPQAKALLDAHKSNFVLGKEQGLQIHIDGEKIRLGSAEAREALAVASKVKDEFEKFRVIYNTHAHPAPHGSPTVSQIGTVGDIGTKNVVTT
jgi:hypothetical protein